MTGTDLYERWLDGGEEADFEALFNERLGEVDMSPPIGVTPETPVSEVIDLMVRHGIGCALVGRDKCVQGIFTERDVLRKIANTEGTLDKSVSQFMTRDPECLTVNDRVVHAVKMMAEGGYRHVPVLRNGRVIGVFGMRSFVGYVVDLNPERIYNAPPPGQRHSTAREGA
jgi:CBS domain-containing protein